MYFIIQHRLFVFPVEHCQLKSTAALFARVRLHVHVHWFMQIQPYRHTTNKNSNAKLLARLAMPYHTTTDCDAEPRFRHRRPSL